MNSRTHLCIVIPAHNEQERIGAMLNAYCHYFSKDRYSINFLVVLNGCTDQTLDVVRTAREQDNRINFIDLDQAGKGLAVKHGFLHALAQPYDYIGFVDADLATAPEYFNDLIQNIAPVDGVIASRYMPGAHVTPPRPWIKRWGSRLIYEPLVRALFGINYYDYQCGAKLFKRNVIECVAPALTAQQWAFDVELLYLCKKFGFTVKEIPTTWHDQAGSKVTIMSSGIRQLASLFQLRWRHIGATYQGAS